MFLYGLLINHLCVMMMTNSKKRRKQVVSCSANLAPLQGAATWRIILEPVAVYSESFVTTDLTV